LSATRPRSPEPDPPPGGCAATTSAEDSVPLLRFTCSCASETASRSYFYDTGRLADARADILLTGAGGFVGGHLVERAAARGLEIAVVGGDVLDAAAVRQAVGAARARAVVHLATARRRESDPLAALAADTRMTLNVIQAVRELTPDARVLVPGSAAQYGLGLARPLRESDPLQPLTAYGEAKSVLELICTSPSLLGDMRIIFTRSFNHVGPGQAEEAPVAHWAKQLAAAEAAGGGVVCTGRLDVQRDFLDVRDVADAYLDLVQSEASGVVNVCSGDGVVLADVAAALIRLVDAPVSLAQDPTLVRSSDPPAVVGDPALLRQLTAFRPRIGLVQSLTDVLGEQRARLVAGDLVVRSG
jgi:GDP-4-dehydro-6-deoxy-D-mannose reductase